ncbi:MAG: histidine kinase [Flavobacteriales bacterium]
MTTPVRSTPSRRATRVLYWSTQVVSWLLFVGLFVLWNYINGTLSADGLKVMGLVFATGVGVSHLFRFFILRFHWLQHDIGYVLPRLSLGALLLGLVAFLLEGVIHDLLFSGFAPLLQRSGVELFGRVLNWTVLLLLWGMAYFGYALFVRSRREEIRNLRLETANRENQLGNLRAQMNPHFMFNALNGIRALIDEDPEQAKRAITQLSAILRNAMATVKRKVVPLGEELDVVKAYLALEAMRYEQRLRVSFAVEDGLERQPVPPMLLQTLVENAVRHGVANIPEGGEVLIGARLEGTSMVLFVRNSGHYVPGRVNGSGIGLRNTRKRLEMIYGAKAHLDIVNRDNMVVTEVIMPLDAWPAAEPT